ncbi:MAG TPA: succinate dehydrogenase cytochrome b subunit [Thermoanaerobaculia bacterium]|nr:succinate dehydrogenase cytochrome b subunit [Thermoanaerobaculia bacterium]
MTWFGNFYRSAIGKKAVMAISGLILFGWIFAHMAGNLKLFFGSEALNHYAEWLRDLGAPIFPHESVLWITRVLLIVAVVFHIHAAYMLTVMNAKARPVGYEDRDFVKGTYAARTMRWGGVIILLFVFYHLAHLTWGGNVAPPAQFIQGDVYHNVVTGFQIWWVSAIYIIANLALGLHLYHGLWAMFSSVGMTNPRFEHWRRTFATVFAIVITAANISFPLSVLTGFVK